MKIGFRSAMLKQQRSHLQLMFLQQRHVSSHAIAMCLQAHLRPCNMQGKDDMRMDERLMQVVRLADALMGADAAAAARGLHARSFAMTPLGPRLGLVQWVENTMPLFQASLRF